MFRTIRILCLLHTGFVWSIQLPVPPFSRSSVPILLYTFNPQGFLLILSYLPLLLYFNWISRSWVFMYSFHTSFILADTSLLLSFSILSSDSAWTCNPRSPHTHFSFFIFYYPSPMNASASDGSVLVFRIPCIHSNTQNKG